jgi:hypothetical protein
MSKEGATERKDNLKETTTTRQTAIDLRRFWEARGTTIRAIKSLPRNPSANQIRVVWDYRAQGLTVDQAREVIAGHSAKVTNPSHGPGGWMRGKRKQRGEYHPATGKYVASVESRRKIAGLLHGASAAEWIEGRMDWRLSEIVLPLPNGGCVVTERHESATWGKHRHWPTSREVWYTSTRLSRSGYEIGKPIRHDRTSGWHGRVLVGLGLLNPSRIDDKSDMARRLNPACAVLHDHHVGQYVVAHRCVAGAKVDVVASAADGTAYHADDAATAISGLRRKLLLKSARSSGKLISSKIASKRWGFCEQGMFEFAEATGLSLEDQYTLDEVRARVTPEIRARFADDLAIAGI